VFQDRSTFSDCDSNLSDDDDASQAKSLSLTQINQPTLDLICYQFRALQPSGVHDDIESLGSFRLYGMVARFSYATC
jgi:hypothetical protein